VIILHYLFWGLLATLCELALDGAAVGLGLTRMSLPLIMGSMWTADRSRAKVLGIVNHLANGLIFTFVYIYAFHLLNEQNWWTGGLIGLVHAALVLLVGMQFLPAIHPRMATEQGGPMAMRQLEPPGFIALNYGPSTPITIVLSHVIFGIVLGAFCR
jgi:uncharacterized membrane protein YagU involved in acid resistance